MKNKASVPDFWFWRCISRVCCVPVVLLVMAFGSNVVSAATNPPVADAATYYLNPDCGLQIAITGSLATNWSDVNSYPVELTGVNSPSTNGMTVTFDGNYIYYPTNSVNDQFTYCISDGHGGTNQGIVNIVMGPQTNSFYLNEMAVARSIPANIVIPMLVGAPPDINGMYSPNATNNPAFYSTYQRTGADDMTGGILLTNDTYVAQGWASFAVTFSYQNASGYFDGNSSNGAYDMAFFLAYFNHAVNLLMQSVYTNKTYPGWGTVTNGTGQTVGQTYSQLVTALLPKIQLAADYFAANRSQMSGDFDSPNRSMVDCCADAFSYQLLKNYSTQSHLTNYQREISFWITNAFVALHPIIGNCPDQHLYRALDGVFQEPDDANFYFAGYDTSYQGFGLRWYLYYLLYFQNDGLHTNQNGCADMAGKFLLTRFPGTKDAGGNYIVDDTYNMRSGAGNLAGSDKVLAVGSSCDTLSYWSLMFGHTNGLTAAAQLSHFAEYAGQVSQLISDTNILAPVDSPFAYVLNISNAGLTNLYSGFYATVSGLPAGLSVVSGPVYNPSTGTYIIAGTPTTIGTNVVTVVMVNQYGSNTNHLTFNVTAPQTSINSGKFNNASGLNANKGNVGFGFTGTPNCIYYVQAATNLVSPVWVPVAAITAGTNGESRFAETNVQNYPHRYYRTVNP
jgi:hypothetical protein